MASKTDQQQRLQVALITGGGSGIGYEITRQLGERPGLVHTECMDHSSSRVVIIKHQGSPGGVAVSNRRATVLLNAAGLHGAKVVITGRRQQVLTDSCAALADEGIAALGVQVLPKAAGWLCSIPAGCLSARIHAAVTCLSKHTDAVTVIH